MKLDEIYGKYVSGEYTKPKYIGAMYKKHKLLFEYFSYIKQTDIKSITIDDDAIFVTIKGSGLKLLLDPDDRRFIPIEILNFKSFDPEEQKILFEIAGESKYIFDIGANIGWYSLNFAKLKSVKKIYSFEPIPHSFGYLKKHLALNHINKVSAQNSALGAEVGEATFFWTPEENGSASMKNIQGRSKIERVTCPLNTLDNFMKNKRFEIDFIKCDVEGAELFVFQGGLWALQKDKPVIFTEMLRKWSAKFSYHPNDIIHLLKGIGYDCFVIKHQKIKKVFRITEKTIETNFLFLDRIKHKNLISRFQ